MTGLIAFVGILVMMLVIFTAMEFMPLSFSFKKKTSLSGAIEDIQKLEVDSVTGLRKTLQPLEVPVGKFTRPTLLKKMKYALYWGQIGGKYIGWTPVQLITMRLFFGVAAALIGGLVVKNLLYVVVCGYLGWVYPMLSLNGVARKTSRQFSAQLPEYLQLVNGQMAGGISFEEAIRRTSSRSLSLPAQWMKNVIQMAQGRNVLDQIMKEAIESQSSDLISTASQLNNLKHGAKQQELIDRLSTQISQTYTASAEMRAEKIGGELVIPITLFYFLPFLACILIVVASPIFQGLL